MDSEYAIDLSLQKCRHVIIGIEDRISHNNLVFLEEIEVFSKQTQLSIPFDSVGNATNPSAGIFKISKQISDRYPFAISANQTEIHFTLNQNKWNAHFTISF
jgi:hypothetical protein